MKTFPAMFAILAAIPATAVDSSLIVVVTGGQGKLRHFERPKDQIKRAAEAGSGSFVEIFDLVEYPYGRIAGRYTIRQSNCDVASQPSCTNFLMPLDQRLTFIEHVAKSQSSGQEN
jgi:hypothetical protein